jgi:hypothetical protein
MYRIFGILAALLALAGSLLGYYLSLSGFPEEVQLAAMIKVPDYLNPDLMFQAMRDNFVPLDLLFYGLAAFLAYLLAIRRISSGKMARLEQADYKGAPALYWLRLPLILAGILIPSYYGYTLTRADSGGNNTLYYDSGSYLGGMKEGLWKYYHENGSLKYSIHYKAGKFHGEKILLSSSGEVINVDFYENGVLKEQD